MNKLSALSLFALATMAGSAKAEVFSECQLQVPFAATTISCTTPNGATAGRVTGTLSGGVANTIVVNQTKETNVDDKTTGFGKNNSNITFCSKTDRNPSFASTETDTGCAGATILRLAVDNRDNSV